MLLLVIISFFLNDIKIRKKRIWNINLLMLSFRSFFRVTLGSLGKGFFLNKTKAYFILEQLFNGFYLNLNLS